jgi:hypothetical protein
MISDSLCGYGRIHDPAVLRIAVQELARIREWLGQAADIAAESPQLSDDHVLGIHAAADVIVHLQRLAATRLAVVTARQRPAAVTVLDPGPPELGWSSPVSEAPVVSVPAVAAAGLSSSVVSLSPGHASVPRSYPDDMIVMGIIGTIQVIWWDATGAKHQLDSPRRHHTHVRRGTRHCLYNAGLLPAYAVQSRANPDMTADVDWAGDLLMDPPVDHAMAEHAIDEDLDPTGGRVTSEPLPEPLSELLSEPLSEQH